LLLFPCLLFPFFAFLFRARARGAFLEIPHIVNGIGLVPFEIVGGN
jgi:hypothetical protein